MNRCRKYSIAALLTLVALPMFAQSVTKQDVLGFVTLSGALIRCGHIAQGKQIGLAAVNLFPQFGLNDKSDEVIEAMMKGKNVIDQHLITCADAVNHAKQAGIQF